jgi:hypothetical protein
MKIIHNYVMEIMESIGEWQGGLIHSLLWLMLMHIEEVTTNDQMNFRYRNDDI